jgi:serine/threonine protein kinase
VEAGAWTSAPVPNLSMELRVGGFRLLRPIGSGGMGEVWEAEQQRPRRRVALKLVRSDLLTPSLKRRFEFEAEVLGRLEHDGIARIFEAGIDDASGRPYFAMEFVDGKRLDSRTVLDRFDRAGRLRLFVELCRAVQAAHQRGVVHRDLKPANVLVRDDGKPKILDFGVARLNDGDAGATQRTEAGAIVGTLAYMSPEQAAGDSGRVDTRSDVYALGVILYELLTGKLPIDVTGQALHTAVRAIVEREPAPAASIDRSLRGDLDTIVRRAMEKNPDRRYPSADALADDVQRHLSDEPIQARPPSTLYLLGKFVRRRKALSIATGVVAIAAVVASGALSVAISRAADAKQNAQLYDGLRDSMTRSLSPQVAGSASMSGRELFEQSLEQQLTQIDAMPGIGAERAAAQSARLLGEVANMMIDVGDLDAADKAIARGEAKLKLAGTTDTADASLTLFLARAEAKLRRGDERAIDLLRSRLAELDLAGDKRANAVRSRLADALKNGSRKLPLDGRIAAIDEAEAIYKRYLRGAPSAAEDAQSWRIAFDLAQLPIERAMALRAADKPFAEVRAELLRAEHELKAIESATARRPVTQQVELASEQAKLQHRLRRPRSADALYAAIVPRMVETLGADHWRTQEVLLSWATLHRKPPETVEGELSETFDAWESRERKLSCFRTILTTQLTRAGYGAEAYDVALDLAEAQRGADDAESTRWTEWVRADLGVRRRDDASVAPQRERLQRLIDDGEREASVPSTRPTTATSAPAR